MDNEKSELLNALRIERTEQPQGRSIRWGAYAIAAVMVVSAGASVWLMVQDRAQPVQVAIARTLAASGGSATGGSLLDATGYAVARRQATVGPKISGKLRDVLVEEGMHVDAGQVIAHLDDSNAVATLNQAQATVDQAATSAADARPVFERSEAQLAQGLISRESYDSAKSTSDQTRTALEVARSALAVAQQNKDDTEVRAPFAGVVTAKAAQPGEIISPVSAGAGFTRTGIATIVDMDSLEADVDENYINRVRPVQHCTITLNAYPDWRIPGHVIAVVPQADRTKATLPVRVALDTKDPRILPEMGLRVAFLADATTGDSAARSIAAVVPSQAVISSGTDEGVVFVVHDGRVERRAVRLGQQTSQGQVVKSGVSGGEVVAIGGLDKLTHGVKVRFTK